MPGGGVGVEGDGDKGRLEGEEGSEVWMARGGMGVADAPAAAEAGGRKVVEEEDWEEVEVAALEVTRRTRVTTVAAEGAKGQAGGREGGMGGAGGTVDVVGGRARGAATPADRSQTKK